MEKKKFIVASLWSSLGQYAYFAINFAGQVALARILLPEHFGIMALALAVQGLAEIALSFSIPIAYIHFKETDTLFSSALLLSFFNWLLLMAIVCIALYPVYYYYQGEVALFIFLLSLFRWFSSVSSIHLAKLEKELNFKKAVLISGTSTVIGLGVAIVTAFGGTEEYSLLYRELLTSVLIFFAAKYYVRMPLYVTAVNRDEIRMLFKYSYKMFFSRGFTILYQRLPFLFMGTYYSVSTVGYMSQAFYLAMLYNRLMSSFTQKIAFIFYSHFKEYSRKREKGFLYINGAIVLFGGPVFIVFFFFPSELLVFLWGEKWIGATLFLKTMAVFAILNPIYENMTSYFYGLARNEIITYSYIVGIVSYFLMVLIWHETMVIGMAFSLSMLAMVLFSSYFYRRLHVK